MKSGFYLSSVHHARFIPKRYQFNFHFFWTYFNLDEIDDLDHRTFLFSRNKFNVISFYDKDHLHIGKKNLKENVISFLCQNSKHSEKLKSCEHDQMKVTLVTNPRILGYTFNPVSFYFIHTPIGPFLIAEIGNTFHEQKPYLVEPESYHNGRWIFETKKEFYISPFASVHNKMVFNVELLENKNLKITINDYKEKDLLEIKTTYHGKFKEWNTHHLIKLLLRFPLLTYRIILMIHFHAFVLFLKKIPYFKKNDDMDHQKNFFKKQG